MIDDRLVIFDKDGGYEYKGCYYDDMESLLQCGVLEMCGCGCPSENIKFVAEGLKLVGMDYLDRRKKEDEYFGNEISAQFFYYTVDKLVLVEHGGCIPGWLTKKGKEFIRLAEGL